MFSNAFLLMKIVLLEITLRWNYYLILTKKVSNETVSNFSLGGQSVAIEQGNILLIVWYSWDNDTVLSNY